MILTLTKRALLAAMIFQAKKDPRYYLCGICFAPDKKLYSTDGHRLFVGHHSTEGLENNIIIQLKGPRFTKFDTAHIDTDTGIMKYLDEDGEVVSVALVKEVDGKFPDVERVIPKDSAPVSEIGFNAGYLAGIEKAAKLYNPKWPGIVIKTNGNIHASIIELNSVYEEAKIVLMPCRI